MNIANLRLIVRALEKEGVIKNPNRAFVAQDSDLYYANSEIEVYVENLAKELSVRSAFDPIPFNDQDGWSKGERAGKKRSVERLKGQIAAGLSLIEE
ncbi:MAG: hypothetical protein NTY66_02855 [Candidatus Vogelbacteria bacterium]|nr:hypothetical protein [Candidatus Vogelbacteria bacterium]